MVTSITCDCVSTTRECRRLAVRSIQSTAASLPCSYVRNAAAPQLEGPVAEAVGVRAPARPGGGWKIPPAPGRAATATGAIRTTPMDLHALLFPVPIAS